MTVVGLVVLTGAALSLGVGSEPSAPTAMRVVVPASRLELLPVQTETPSPPPSPSATPGPPVFAVAPGSSEVWGSGPLRRFTVEVEEGTGVDPTTFAAEVERVLSNDRSWIGSGKISLQRVGSGGSFRVTLASSATTHALCLPLDTGRTLSCYQRGRAVLNLYRWHNGSPYFPDLPSYRNYMINHEVGHALGHGHTGCPAPGEPAPVMMQQTKGLGGCTPNGWPLPEERR